MQVKGEGFLRFGLLLGILIIFTLGIPAHTLKAQTPDKTDFTDNLIGSTFKTLAKAFVATADINKLKEDNIKKLEEMDDKTFSEHYLEIYDIIKTRPALTVDYGLPEGMTRLEAIEKIRALDKKELYQAIDAIPNSLIAAQFRAYLNEKKEAIQQSNLVRQIQQFWDKMIRKVRE